MNSQLKQRGPSFLYLCFFGLLTLCCDRRDLEEGYWLWAGVSASRLPQDCVAYVHVGAVSTEDGLMRFEPQGLGARTLGAERVILVFRMNSLVAADDLLPLLEAQASRWMAQKNEVRGIQLDYDSPTARLLRYEDMLGRLRSQLDASLILSVTGLVDWVASGDRGHLARLAAQVDEVIFQLYRGREYPGPTINQMDWLTRLDFEFKVGLLADHPANAGLMERLRKIPHLKGVNYFII